MLGKKIYLAALLAPYALSSCGPLTTETQQKTHNGAKAATESWITTAADRDASQNFTAPPPALPGPSVPSMPSPEEPTIQARARDLNDFGINLYQQLAQQDKTGNILISPLSLQAALALLYPGTEPESRSAHEFRKALHFAGDPQRVFHPNMAAYLRQLTSLFEKHRADGSLRWNMVQKVWVDRQFILKKNYLDTLTNYYGASVGVEDFRSSPETASRTRDSINRYIADETHDLIQDLLPPGSVTDKTSVLLTNAIYLLADWQYPFTQEATQPGTFTTLTGDAVPVSMMDQTHTFPYMETPDYQALSLPYADGDFALVMVLPKNRGQFFDMEKKLRADLLSQDILSALRPTKVQVKLPKFTLRWGSQSLKSPLSALGFRQVWQEGPQFPALGYLRGAPTTTATWIDDVYHKTTMIVDEKGTEAAAASGVVVVSVTSAGAPSEMKHFTVDQPILFYLIDAHYQSILFTGRLANPS